jgi:hypothetical protein
VEFCFSETSLFAEAVCDVTARGRRDQTIGIMREIQ